MWISCGYMLSESLLLVGSFRRDRSCTLIVCCVLCCLSIAWCNPIVANRFLNFIVKSTIPYGRHQNLIWANRVCARFFFSENWKSLSFLHCVRRLFLILSAVCVCCAFGVCGRKSRATHTQRVHSFTLHNAWLNGEWTRNKMQWTTK